MAKARRRPVKNPSIPRLGWVAKTYPAWVWWYTAVGWMEAAGMDDVAQTLVYEIDELSSADPEVVQHRLERLMNVLGRYAVDHDAENTEYDKYIPWLAKSVNSLGKSESKKLRRILEKEYPGLIYMDATFTVTPLSIQEGMGKPILMAIDAMGPGEASNAAMSIDVANEAIAELQLGFGTVVRWAIDKDINLDGYDPLEAVELAKEWARTRPKDEAIVGGDVVYEFDDGWTFQELKTRPQLEYEGKYLDHCVRGYRASKIGVVYRIFSLRDPDGFPVATMEWKVEDEYVSQYYGLSNKDPERDEVERAIEFRLKYIDEDLVEEDQRLEVVPPDSPDAPPFVSHISGFAGVFTPPEGPDDSFAVFLRMSGLPRTGYLVWSAQLADVLNLFHDEEEEKHGPGDAADSATVARVREWYVLGEFPEVRPVEAWWDWAQWKYTGMGVGYRDGLVKQIARHGLRPEGFAVQNPRKRKANKQQKKLHSTLLLEKSHRLWETYDARPLKKHLVAFGKHVERMQASGSAKVKDESRRAARAFNAEFKARGWKR